MKTASLSELKKELSTLPQEEVVNLCLQLTRYKKENKELLNYLLFEASNETQYINQVKEEIQSEFETINTNNLYFAKKTIRRILKILKKYIKYSGNKETEIELLLFFCKKLKDMNFPLHENKVINNMYFRQLLTISKVLDTLHEDLQYDYQQRIEALMN